ncbi:hypothetical protein V9T40_005268 [Parthenolecanium corni]|uniref:EB domain-containing protein n=1 Tax=Parthenolecanium corni TaxID=536013 RepID=A0AAN9TG12_9HEMI
MMQFSSKSEQEKIHKYGATCNTSTDCGFDGAICEETTAVCRCDLKLPAFNGHDRCGKGIQLNQSCQFDEQCEYFVWNSMCKNSKCVCRGDGKPVELEDGSIKCKGKQFGDPCESSSDCAFRSSICDPNKRNCQCLPGLVATDHIDKCGEVKKVNEDCFFNEQCEQMLFDTICVDGRCSCRAERVPVINTDGSIKCIVPSPPPSDLGTDPTMIIVLTVMCLMFIIICVVLHLFSKARWRENRTIFNTPNPRLMNVSLLREKKIERRSSREGSTKGFPSREPSMASLRPHSPSIESKNVFRRESRGAGSNSSVRSPTTLSSPTML